MSIAAQALDKRALTLWFTAVLFIGGLGAFFTLGQLEDPEFTIKEATIQTFYPGASPEDVELEVTDRIETALQEMKQLEMVESQSWPSYSYVKVEIAPEYWSDVLPQVWDEMRRKVQRAFENMPPGVSDPVIADDYGDVFGFQLLLVGDGFSYAEMERWAKDVRKELVSVDGIARIDLVGVQDRRIYLDVAPTQLSQLGISDESIALTLQNQNLVVNGGGVSVQDQRFRIAPSGSFSSPAEIGNLTLRPSLLDSLQRSQPGDGSTTDSELIRLDAFAQVREGYVDPAQYLIRRNGFPAITLSITNVSGANIVDVGRNLDRAIAEIRPWLPVGLELQRMHWQSDAVTESIDSFIVSFAEAVAIVLVVLALAMGWRMGVIIGTALIGTVLGTFIVMALLDIDLHRMSLGALVIALGMMVDNAIVVADGALVRMQQGMGRREAAIEAASQPSTALFGATLVAVMAFFPIYISPEDTGEYCATLFEVVAISLIISWLVSVTLTPLQCMAMLPEPKADGGDPYAGTFYEHFRGVLRTAIKWRWLTLTAMAALLVWGVVGFGDVRQMFFPNSSMNKFMVDLYLPKGKRMEATVAAITKAEEKLLADERVTAVTSYVGGGSPRFYLPVVPEDPMTTYGHLIVEVTDYRLIDDMIKEFQPWLELEYPDAITQPRKFVIGPGETWEFQLRLSAPGVADPDTLREYARKIQAIIDSSDKVGASRIDWGNRVQKIVPRYSQQQGRDTSITREDLAASTQRAYDGLPVGLYREEDSLIPILLHHVEAERSNISGIEDIQIKPALAPDPVPLSQVVTGVDAVWEDPVINRRDRMRTVKILANAKYGLLLSQLRNDVSEEIFALELPPGFRLEWGGITEDEVDSVDALIPGIVPSAIIIVSILIALFNAYRPTVVILLTVPLALIGITAGLLGTNTPFGFMALLGAMSLVGMMIKNSIVLLEEVELNLERGLAAYESVQEAAVSRLRPVVLAAATTVLGVVPLLQDLFWVSMAATIMAGLAFGTLLTMLILPVVYATLYRIKMPVTTEAPATT